MYQKTIKVPLKSILAVQEFVRVVESSKCHVDVSDGCSTANGASIVGLMNLNLKNKLTIHIVSDTILDIEETAEKIKRFTLVNEDNNEDGV